MAVQLSLNQGPQDALLFDNTKSYFTNVGYQRTSNFQMQLRDVTSQNAANFGQKVDFIIPKAADLLGPIDLEIEFNAVEKPLTTSALATGMLPGHAQMWGWVDNVGYAMIEKITFSVGSHDVETLTGESLNIINELMRSGSSRHGFAQTLKTGRPLFKQELDGGVDNANVPSSTVNYDPNPLYTSYDRIISYVHRHEPKNLLTESDGHAEHHSTWYDSLQRPGTAYPHETLYYTSSGDLDCVAKQGKRLSIPLGLFFTSHPSKYFPIAAIAGCNDIRVSIKFRNVKEVMMQKGTFTQNDKPNNGPIARNESSGVAFKMVMLNNVDLKEALRNVSADVEFSADITRIVAAAGAVAPTASSVSIDHAVWEVRTVLTTTGGTGASAPKFRIISVTQTQSGNFASPELIASYTFNYFSGNRLYTRAAVGNTAAVVASYGTPITSTIPTRWTKATGDAILTGMRLLENKGSGSVTNLAPKNDSSDPPVPTGGNWFKECKLRCHYVHVTGPEATSLMNKEHVRLMKLMDETNKTSKQFKIKCSTKGTPTKLEIDLNFLHPVQEIIITIRKVSEMGSNVTNSVVPGTGDVLSTLSPGGLKNYFAYHGGGRDPNYENFTSSVDAIDPVAQISQPTYLKTTAFQLKLNGQSRHLDGQGISRDYLMNRLMPMIHSAAREDYTQVSAHSELQEFEMLAELMDRKEIYVYPFALNPEGANPSGSVNFSKVSHARLEISVDGFASGLSSAALTVDDDYIVDVYGMYFNWLAIKDGRALTSFA